jgi:ABC-type sulfate transport system permease component
MGMRAINVAVRIENELAAIFVAITFTSTPRSIARVMNIRRNKR